MHNSSKQTQRSQDKNIIDFNNLIMENSNIINNNIDMTKNIENHAADSVPTFVPTAESRSQELETTVQFADAIVIEDDGISTLPLSSSQKELDNFKSTLKYLSI